MSAYGFMTAQGSEVEGATRTTVVLPTKIRMKPFASLLIEVIRKNICDACGACIATCPVSVVAMKPAPGKDEIPTLIGRCILCQYCYYSCPRIELPESEKIIKGKMFGPSFSVMPHVEDDGPYINSYSAQAKNEAIRQRGTDSGVITSLLMYLLDQRIVDVAVTSKINDQKLWSGIPHIALNSKDALIGAGTTYNMTPVHEGLRRAWEEYDKHEIAFAGLPCEIHAARKMQYTDYGYLQMGQRIKVTVGLFCGGAFYYDKLKEFLIKDRGIPLETVKKMNITEGTLRVYLNSGETQVFPLKLIDTYRRDNCRSCPYGFSAWLADVSVGAIGSPSGWVTVLTRTKIGEEIFQNAVQAGYVEIAPPREGQPDLIAVARLEHLKKKRLAKFKAEEAAAAVATRQPPPGAVTPSHKAGGEPKQPSKP